MVAGTVPKGRTRGKSELHRAGCWVARVEATLRKVQQKYRLYKDTILL